MTSIDLHKPQSGKQNHIKPIKSHSCLNWISDSFIIIKILIIATCLFFIESNVFAQSKNAGLKNNGLVKTLKIADQLYEEHSYYNASDYYETLYKASPQNEYVIYKLGMAYFYSRDYKNAHKFLLQLYEKKEKASYPLGIFHFGETLKMMGQYEEAKKAFFVFLKSKGKSKDITYYRSITKNEIISCTYALDMVAFDTVNSVKIELFPGKINNAYSDFSPHRQGNDTLIFASLRADSVIKVKYESEESHPVKLYKSIREDSSWSEPSDFTFNHNYDHTANGTYSPDKKIFVFTRCRPDKNYITICTLFESQFKNGKWSAPKKIKGFINKRKFTTTQPAFASSTKTVAKKKVESTVLYFVSNRKGGRGKNDIWYSLVTTNGKFAKPVNCGPRINTPRDEITPYYDNQTKNLYFSSNYHWNAGGYDVFKSGGSLNRWAKPVNLGLSINSTYDDTYYAPVNGSQKGLIVSNRPGGLALKSETCCDDIYEVEYIEPPLIAYSGTVNPKNIKKKRLLKDVRVGIIPTARLNKHIKKYSNISFLEDSIQWLDKSDSLGQFDFKTSKAKNYSVLFVKDSFDITSISLDSIILIQKQPEKILAVLLPDLRDTTQLKVFSDDVRKMAKMNVPTRDSLDIKKLEVSMKTDMNIGDVFILDNMYFDTDEDIIKKEAAPSLSLLMKFLKEHPNIKIEIAGHTDSHASEKHNLDLSQRRANRILNYVKAKGVDKKRLVAVGYGESLPIAPNENADGTDNPEGRKINRRTEIKILGDIEE